MEAHKELSKNPSEIIIESGDDILCDNCNDAIDTPFIHLVEFGRRVVCQACWESWYKAEAVVYRHLNADGTLGNIIRSENEQDS